MKNKGGTVITPVILPVLILKREVMRKTQWQMEGKRWSYDSTATMQEVSRHLPKALLASQRRACWIKKQFQIGFLNLDPLTYHLFIFNPRAKSSSTLTPQASLNQPSYYSPGSTARWEVHHRRVDPDFEIYEWGMSRRGARERPSLGRKMCNQRNLKKESILPQVSEAGEVVVSRESTSREAGERKEHRLGNRGNLGPNAGPAQSGFRQIPSPALGDSVSPPVSLGHPRSPPPRLGR